jgi:hypothetical protein
MVSIAAGADTSAAVGVLTAAADDDDLEVDANSDEGSDDSDAVDPAECLALNPVEV